LAQHNALWGSAQGAGYASLITTETTHRCVDSLMSRIINYRASPLNPCMAVRCSRI